MVIFEDLQKLLLYQRLNLGFECDVCKRKSYNRLEHLLHISSCKKVSAAGQFLCKLCGKNFNHEKIFQLHMQFHNLSESSEHKPLTNETRVKTECIDISESDKDEDNSTTLSPNENQTQCTESNLQDCNSHVEPEAKQQLSESQTGSCLFESSINQEIPKQQASHVIRTRRKTVHKKKVGLTKVRMEDCLRCDACSCIYIDPKDYYKHMRNFHQVDVDNSPIPQPKSKKKCRSCCKQCRGVNCRGAIKKPRATQLASNLIFRINMRDNIKNRWTRMVSQQLSACPEPQQEADPVPEVNIKPDPDAMEIKPDPDLNSIDLSHLLSQVEVKIKVEPPDDFPY